MEEKTVIVVGGGAAGMMACAAAAKRVRRVILIEKNNILGKKLRITGKGRCNITNAAPIDEFISNVPTNGRFLYSAFSTFSNDDVVELLKRAGVETKTERGGRIFPQSDSARDVAEAMKKNALKPNVKWIKTEAIGLKTEDGRVTGVKTPGGVTDGDSVILATGGKSYPLTGSDGRGYELAEEAGHTIICPRPSLIPIETREKWTGELMGLTLKNVSLSVAKKNGKVIFEDFGEMLFTHFGISGPIVLSASAHMRDMAREEYKIRIDLKPALAAEALDKRICRDFEKYANKHIQNALDDLLPKALIPVIIRLAGLDPHKAVNSVTRAERQSLLKCIKGLTMTAKGFRPIEEAIVTSGGVKISEINPSTMESKLVGGLYFAGEIIDVDAYTGGFNLQIAFSTGYLAGQNA